MTTVISNLANSVRIPCAAAVLAWSASSFGFLVNSADSEIRDAVVLITANVSIEFTDVVVEALESGIPITLETEIRVYRVRDGIWDKRVATKRILEQVHYRTFPVTYVVKSADPAIAGAYSRYSEAIAALGGTRVYQVQLPEKDFAADTPTDLRSAIKISLDRTKLPGALRMQSYFNNAWRLKTKWFKFEVQ